MTCVFPERLGDRSTGICFGNSGGDGLGESLRTIMVMLQDMTDHPIVHAQQWDTRSVRYLYLAWVNI